MNIVFLFLVVSSVVVSALSGNMNQLTEAIALSAGEAVERIFGLIGILTLWLGIAKIAEKSGLLETVTKLLQPIVRILFPSIPKGHPAMGAILMNISANLFGFGSAATPFGLKAMEHLQKLNRSNQASQAMCTFLAINTSSVTLIPSTIIALRVNAGSANPMEIIGTILFATTVSTIVAIVADFFFRLRSEKGGWR
ncbi:MAG: spore maturation protein [Clostridiales bacterium]|nr:spore maturation protein [Clostridiales bacterium]